MVKFALMFVELLKMLAARFLMLTFGTFAFIYTHFRLTAKAIRRGSFDYLKKSLRWYYWQLAFADDQKGNVLCQEVFNDWFVKNAQDRYNYGKPDHTVSHVTGVNEERKNLTFLGRLLAGILNAIDEGHTERAAKNNQFNG